MTTADKKGDKIFDYIFFARAYLMLAYSGLQHRKENLLGTDLVYDMAHKGQYIIAPILYNIKHAIELFIKSVAKILELDDQDFKKRHNLLILFSKIKENLKKTKITEESINELEKLVIKYHQTDFLAKKLKNNLRVIDEQNDIFRYPDNSAKIELNFEEIFYQFEANDFKQIEDDIKLFYTLFYDIGAEILKINEAFINIEKN